MEGHAAHVLAGDTSFPEPQRTVRLLPEYDVYVMGFRERDQLVLAAIAEEIRDFLREDVGPENDEWFDVAHENRPRLARGF